MKKLLLLSFILTSILTSLSGCGPKGNQPNVELLQDMMVQEAIKAQRYDEYFANGISQLVPPEHTQPIGFKPYRYGLNADLADQELKNPLAGQMSPEVLLVGEKYYSINCLVCHGSAGLGDGPVAAKYPVKIPSLVSDKVKKWSDARIFHTITVGQGLMGAYASHIPQKYRWQVVNYIRTLQK